MMNELQNEYKYLFKYNYCSQLNEETLTCELIRLLLFQARDSKNNALNISKIKIFNSIYRRLKSFDSLGIENDIKETRKIIDRLIKKMVNTSEVIKTMRNNYQDGISRIISFNSKFFLILSNFPSSYLLNNGFNDIYHFGFARYTEKNNFNIEKLKEIGFFVQDYKTLLNLNNFNLDNLINDIKANLDEGFEISDKNSYNAWVFKNDKLLLKSLSSIENRNPYNKYILITNVEKQRYYSETLDFKRVYPISYKDYRLLKFNLFFSNKKRLKIQKYNEKLFKINTFHLPEQFNFFNYISFKKNNTSLIPINLFSIMEKVFKQVGIEIYV